MFSYIKYLKFLIDNRDSVYEIIREKEAERIIAEAKNNAHRLNLCFKHRQEQNHSHYSENNCDHCKLLEKVKQLEESQNECD